MSSNRNADVEREISELEALDRPALLQRWRSAFGQDAPPRLSRALMKKAIAHNIQIKACGGLSARVIRALKVVAKPDARPAALARPPGPGTRLVREWNGVLYEVEVLDGGFLWQGRQHRSLSAIAREITGTRWSGPRFFGIRGC